MKLKHGAQSRILGLLMANWSEFLNAVFPKQGHWEIYLAKDVSWQLFADP
jgi:hypothetical protein